MPITLPGRALSATQLPLLCLTLGIALSSPSSAASILLGAGSQAKAHPLDLRTFNLILQQNFSEGSNGWNADWELDFGNLATNVGHANWGGAGMGVNYALTPNARFRIGGRISYLDKYQFIYQDDKQVYRRRDYGGHRQFSFSTSLIWHLSADNGPGIGYRFEHMSNAYLYQSNPGIDTHNLVLYLPLSLK